LVSADINPESHSDPEISSRQAGSSLSNGLTPDDGYTIYTTDPVYQLETSHAAALKARV